MIKPYVKRLRLASGDWVWGVWESKTACVQRPEAPYVVHHKFCSVKATVSMIAHRNKQPTDLALPNVCGC